MPLPAGVVLNILSWFAHSLVDALWEAAETADIRVLQLLQDTGVVASCTTCECQCQSSAAMPRRHIALARHAMNHSTTSILPLNSRLEDWRVMRAKIVPSESVSTSPH